MIHVCASQDKPHNESINKLEYLDRFFNEVLRLYGAAARYAYLNLIDF